MQFHILIILERVQTRFIKIKSLPTWKIRFDMKICIPTCSFYPPLKFSSRLIPNTLYIKACKCLYLEVSRFSGYPV